MNPFHLTESDVVQRLGYGTASFDQPGFPKGSFEGVIQMAWECGVRYFDTAPLYGSSSGSCGLAERRLGAALAGQPRDSFVLSTKVGRIIDNPDSDGIGDSCHFDFTAEGVERSIEASLSRLSIDRIDILFIHDPTDHWETAINEAWPVLESMRDQGIVRAIGAGMTETPMLARFARETSMDIFLIAGRYSLLDRDALDELFPLCLNKNISVLVAQALHGGLIDGVSDPHLYYRPTTQETQIRVERIAGICHSNGIPTAAAAIQFPLAHPAVTGLLTGPATADQLLENLSWLEIDVPAGVWSDLKREELLEPGTPVPSERGDTHSTSVECL